MRVRVISKKYTKVYVLIVAALVAAIGAYTVLRPSEDSIVEVLACSGSENTEIVDEAISKSSGGVDIAEVESGIEAIERLGGSNGDPTCLFILTKLNIVIGDNAKARESFGQLLQLDESSGIAIHDRLGTYYLDNTQLEAEISFSEQQIEASNIRGLENEPFEE